MPDKRGTDNRGSTVLPKITKNWGQKMGDSEKSFIWDSKNIGKKHVL